MSNKTILRRPKRVSCVGDLRDRVTLHDRTLIPPVSGSVDATEQFAPAIQRWAKVKTIAGKTIFTSANVDVALTHEITIRFDSSVTAETWLELLDGTFLDIVATEDLEERHQYLVLRCTERGASTLQAAQA